MKHFLHAIKVSISTCLFILLFKPSLNAQFNESLIGCNVVTPYVNNAPLSATVLPGNMSTGELWTGAFGVLVVGGIANTGNITDANTTNFGTMSYTVAAAGGLRTTVGFNNGNMPIGYYTGFVISNTTLLSLSAFSAFSVKTYLGNVLQDEANTTNGLLSVGLVNTGGMAEIGLISTKVFDRVMIEINLGLGISLLETRVYYAFAEKFCAETTLPTSQPCNQWVPLQKPAYPVYIETGRSGINVGTACANCAITNPANILDNNNDNYAEINILAALGATGSIAVKNARTVYPAGMFAGYEIDLRRTLGVGIGTYYTITTYLADVKQDESIFNAALASGGVFSTGGKFITGFKTTKNFDEIRFTLNNSVAAGANPVRVYNAVIKRFCAGEALSCNTAVALTENAHGVFVDGRHTGVNGVACVNCDIIDANNAIDNVTTNYTQVVLPVAAVASAAYAVSSGITTYNTDPAKPVFAGFDIESPTLLGVNALNGLSVATLLNGVVQQTATSATGLLSAQTSLVSGFGRQTVGFIPTLPFDGIKIVFDASVNINLGTTRIYSAVVKEFCEAEPPCNDLVPAKNPALPVYVNGLRTGIEGVACVGCQINNAENLVNGSTAQPASIILAAAVGSKASVSVADAIGSYPVGSFAGFDVESAALLSADVAGRMTIDLYNNGTRVYSGAANSLLVGAGTSVLTGGPNRQIVGIVSPVIFDEVQLNIENVVGANLGTILVYQAYIQRTCATAVDCSTNGLLNNDQHGAVINAAETGVRGGVCAACTVQGPWDAVSASTTDYARLYNTVAGITTNSLSVAVPAYTFPAGTFAGFQIRKNNFLVAAGLFPYLTIATYNNGTLQESRTGSGLLDLAVLVQLLGMGNTVYIPGFYTTLPFDEVKITVGSLVTALDQYVDVYGAYVDVRTYTVGGGIVCNISQPDVNVGFINQPIAGNVHTNDKVLPGTTYGTTINVPAGVTNPSASLPVVQPNGTYTFTATVPGVYQFYISVCPPATTDNCKLELLTITVQDNAVTSTNTLVVNTDIAVTSYNTPVTIASLANDWPGDNGYLFVPTGMQLTDLNGAAAGNTAAGGTATINTTNGNVTYTPPVNFVGVDTIRYTICNNAPVPQCGGAYQIVRILPPGAGSVIADADDLGRTNLNTPLTVSAANGVLTNDTHSGAGTLSVTALDTTIAGVGHVVIAANGSYVFTPAPGFVGSVGIPYTTVLSSNPAITASATLYLVVDYEPVYSQPDINAGLMGAQIEGDVSTNDKFPTTGVTYGTPVPAGSYPGGTTIVMNADGTYTFVAPVPGVYEYNVPVCTGPGICRFEKLTITVKDFSITVSNTPVVNTDVAATRINQPVTINVLANDRTGTSGFALVRSGVTIADLNGATAGNSVFGGVVTANTVTGALTYTPAAGFIGRDTIRYTVCDNQPVPQCGSAFVIVDVYPENMGNTVTAADDYFSIGKGGRATITAANGVLANDTDAEGNTLTAVTVDSIITGKGRIQIMADGSYIFTSEPGYAGTIVVPYTVLDNGSPQASAQATLYIVVREVPDLTPILTMTPAVIRGTTNINVVVRLDEVNNVSTNGLITVYLAKHRHITLNFTQADISLDGVPVQNSKWTLDATSHPGYYILTTNEVVAASGNLSFGLSGVFAPGQTNGRINLTTTIISGSGKEENNLNNSMAIAIQYTHN